MNAPYPPPLNAALCALSFFRSRHVWKANRKGGLVRKIRIKDWSHYGAHRDMCRKFIRQARALGWRGSIVQAVTAAKEGSR